MNRYDSYESDSTNQLLSFVCGAIAGAAAALLFAPMRGQEMRATLGDAARQGKDRLREYTEAGKEWAQDSAQSAGRWAQDQVGQGEQSGRSSLDETRASIDDGLDRTGSALSGATSRVEDALDRTGSTLKRNLDDARATAREDGRPGDPLGDVRSRESW